MLEAMKTLAITAQMPTQVPIAAFMEGVLQLGQTPNDHRSHLQLRLVQTTLATGNIASDCSSTGGRLACCNFADYPFCCSTPTGTSATNTPTRGRSMSAGRDTLPPPPPPPTEVTTNGPVPGVPGVPAGLPGHLLNRTNSGSRSGSPHSTPTPTPPRQLSRDETPEPLHNDILPPPPPIPDMANPPVAAPPPPPPPPPLPSALPNGQLGKAPGTTSPPLNINGDVGKSPNKQVCQLCKMEIISSTSCD